MNENEWQLFADAVVVAQNKLAVNNTAGRPEKFQSALFPDLFSWKAHFSYFMDKHGWTDEQARSSIPTLLVGWAMQEFNAMPRQYRVQEQDQPAPTLARKMTYLDPRMSPYRNPRTARTEFKNLAQGEKEDIWGFSRRVRSLGEIAEVTMNAARRDNMNREQFIDGLFDLEIQELLLREDPNTFNDAVDRALNIGAISRGSRLRQRRRLATTRYLQQSDQFADRHHVQAVSGQMEPDMMKVEMDMKKQVKNQVDMIKGMSEMMRKFVNSVNPGPQKETTEGRTKTRADCSIRTPKTAATARTLPAPIGSSPGPQRKESSATIALRWDTTQRNAMNPNRTI